MTGSPPYNRSTRADESGSRSSRRVTYNVHGAFTYSVVVRGNALMIRDDERSGAKVADTDADRFRWDWVTFTVLLLLAALFVVLTFDLWAPH